MTDSLTFEAFGQIYQVQTNAPHLLDRVALLLPPLSNVCDAEELDSVYYISEELAGSGESPATYTLFRGSTRLYRGKQIETALARFEDIIFNEVGFWAHDDYLFVHAGVVAIGDKAVILPGESGSGKSTLVSALLDGGATYYSDDMAVFDRDGLVIPYPKPLALRTTESLAKRNVALKAEQIGDRPIAVALVLATKFDPNVKVWSPQQLRGAAAAMVLLRNALAARRLPIPLIDRFRQSLTGALIFEGVRGESGQVVSWINAILR
ncbi:MAG: hypothetical protein ACK2UO_10155 [Caldilineaceae bacterium]